MMHFSKCFAVPRMSINVPKLKNNYLLLRESQNGMRTVTKM